MTDTLVFPACAGMSRPLLCDSLKHKRFPRMRGDEPCSAGL